MLCRSLNAFLPFDRWGVRRNVNVADVILHNSQGGQLSGEFCNDGGSIGAAVHIQRQIMIGHQLQIAERLLCDQPIHQPRRNTNPPKQRIGCKPLQVSREFGGSRREVTDDAHNERIIFRDVQQPRIVFHSRACLDNHRSRHTSELLQCSQMLRQHRSIDRRPLCRPGNSPRTRRIVEVRVAIDDIEAGFGVIRHACAEAEADHTGETAADP